MLYTSRLADDQTATRYPLETAAGDPWQRDADGWVAELTLPACEAQQIIVPSLAIDSGARQQWSLVVGDSRWQMPPFPRKGEAATTPDPRISCHIDCWHSEQALPSATLQVRVRHKPERFLLTLSTRPLQQSPELPMDVCVSAGPPAGISQMQVAEIGPRICSPTALAMVLGCNSRDARYQHIVERCRDQGSETYGVWPLAIRAAALEGTLGAVEVLADWQAAIRILKTGTPLVTSIRFAKGGLSGAPLEQTAGHLVVLYGIDDGAALVADPAAPDDRTVLRRYDLEEFSAAWLAYRGATYIVPV